MKTKEIILLALVAIFSFSSCKGEELGRCDLPKGLIPYKKGQVYSFIDGAGQTINVPVIRTETRWAQSRDETEYDYYTFRSDIIELYSEQDNLKISFRFDADDCILKRGYNEIAFDVIHLDEFCVFTLRTNAEGFLVGDYTSQSVEMHTSFRESTEINGKVYYDVIEKSFVANTGVSAQLFYNKTYGILQINLDGKNFLTLNGRLRSAEADSVSSETEEEDALLLNEGTDESAAVIEVPEEMQDPGSPVSLFPNPSKGVVYIRSANHGAKNIRIYNTLHTMIYQEKKTNEKDFEIDLSGFPNDVYTFIIETNGKQYEQKVMLNK